MGMSVVADGIFTDDVGDLIDVRCSEKFGWGYGGHHLMTWRFQPNGAYMGRAFNPQANVRASMNGATMWEGEFTGARPVGDGVIEATARGYGTRLSDLLSIYVEPVTGVDVKFPTRQLFNGPTPLVPDDDYLFGWEYSEATWNGMPEIVVSDEIKELLASLFPTDSFNVPATHAADKIITLADALTGSLQEQQTYWAVWRKVLSVHEHSAIMAQEPIVYDAPEGFVGIQAEDYRTRIYTWVRVATSVDNTLGYSMGDSGADSPTPLTEFDPKIDGVDYRGIGTQANLDRADALAASTLAQLKGRYIYQDQSLTIKQGMDFPTWAPLVRAGSAMKLNHLRTSMGTLIPDGENFFIIGDKELRWSASSGIWEVDFKPMGAAPRDLATILRGEPGDSGPSTVPVDV